jgi:predicted nucleotidyltransferase
VGSSPASSATEVVPYARQAAERARAILGDRLAAAYLTGGTALGDWEPATSDVDLLLLGAGSITDAQAEALVAELRVESLAPPARRLELTLVTRALAARPRRRPRLALNFDSGPDGLEVHRSVMRIDSHWQEKYPRTTLPMSSEQASIWSACDKLTSIDGES